jgi:hypothetical protein
MNISWFTVVDRAGKVSEMWDLAGVVTVSAPPFPGYRFRVTLCGNLR